MKEAIIQYEDTSSGGHLAISWKPLVRCKDCKHGEKCNSVYLCGKSRGFGIAHEPDFFCADGENKEGQ